MYYPGDEIPEVNIISWTNLIPCSLEPLVTKSEKPQLSVCVCVYFFFFFQNANYGLKPMAVTQYPSGTNQ